MAGLDEEDAAIAAAEVVVSVPRAYARHCDAATMRFGYLHPRCDVQRREDAVLVTGPDEDEVAEAARQLRYLLYREKILADAEALRRKLYDRLLG